MAEGRARLQAWLPAAREQARADGGTVLDMAVAKAQRPYLTEANLDALVLYPGPLGGWHADVLLKYAPPGIANALGTPSGEPARTREEAEERGRTVLAFCLTAVSPPPPAERPAPAFLLYGWSIALVPEILILGTHLAPDREGALARIANVLAVTCPAGFDGEGFDAWPLEDQTMLVAALHRAALSGILAYPPRHDASPSGYSEADGSRA